MISSKPVRYVVQFKEQPDVGYHTSLGRAAKSWAECTARYYRGRLICEYSDGTSEVKGDWTWYNETAAVSV